MKAGPKGNKWQVKQNSDNNVTRQTLPIVSQIFRYNLGSVPLYLVRTFLIRSQNSKAHCFIFFLLQSLWEARRNYKILTQAIKKLNHLYTFDVFQCQIILL